MNRVLWPSLLTVSTSSLCLGLVDVPLDLRGAVRFVLPYHYVGTLSTVLVVVAVFWTLCRYVGWIRRRGAFVLSALYIIVLLSVWAVTLPLGDRIAIHYQRLDPTQQNYLPEPGFGWFYGDDSGMGASPMQLPYLLYALNRPWLVIMFLAFFPAFFHLHRNSSIVRGYALNQQHDAIL